MGMREMLVQTLRRVRKVARVADGSAAAGGQGVDDLGALRETAGCVFREDHVAVGLDVEDPLAAGDQLSVDSEAVFDLGRQTGGAWFVVSDLAVIDGDFHGGYSRDSFRRKQCVRAANDRRRRSLATPQPSAYSMGKV